MAEPTATPPPISTAQDEMVHVVSPIAGEVVRVPRSQLDAAKAQGFALAAPEQVQQRRDVEEYGGFGGMVQAGLAGAGRALTLGASDVVGRALGAGDDLEALKRVNPGSSLIGEIGGTVLGGALSGGESLAARALSAPTRAAMALGEGAGGIAAKALGEGVVSSVVRAGTEGLVFGAGQAVSEAALSDRYDKLGELLASNAGLGAMMGGGTALGLMLLGKGASALGKAARSRLSTTIADPGASALATVQAGHFGTAVADDVGVAAKMFGKASSMLGAGEADKIAGFVSTGESGARRRALALNAEKIYTSQLDEVAKSLQDVHAASDTMGSLFSGEMKREAVVRMLADSGGIDASQAAATVRAAMDEAQQMATRLGGDPVAAAAIKDLSKQIGKLERKVAADPSLVPQLDALKVSLADAQASHAGEATLSKDGLKVKSLHDEIAKARARMEAGLAAGTDDGLADAYIAADQAKRQIGNRTALLRDRGGEGLHGITPTQRATFYEMQKAYERMRPMLEDGAWGHVADAQRGINQAWSRVFEGAEEAGGSTWKRALTESFKDRSTSAFGIERSRISKTKVGEFMNGLTNPAESETWKAINQQLDDRIGFIKAAQEHLTLSPAQQALANQALKSVESAKKSLALVGETAQARAEYNALRGTSGGSIGAGLVGGAISGGSLGLGALGGAYGAVRNPVGVIEKIAAVEQLTGRSARIVRDATGLHQVAALQNMAASSAARQTNAFASIVRRGERVAEYIVPRTGLAVSSYSRIRPDRAEFERRAAMQRKLAMTPETIAKTVAHALADIAPHAPQTTAAATQALANTVAYLNAALPKLGMNGLGPPLPPSHAEQHAFVQKARAVEDPDSLFDQLGKGTVSPFAIEAVRATAPALFADAQQRAVEALADGIKDGRVPSYDDRVRLGIALDLPLDPMLEPDMMRDMQLAYAPQPPPNPAPMTQDEGAAMKRSVESSQSTTDRLGAAA